MPRPDVEVFGMSATSEPVGTLETALEHTQRLMTSEPRLAAEQATEILKVAPGHPLATLLLGVAHRAPATRPRRSLFSNLSHNRSRTGRPRTTSSA